MPEPQYLSTDPNAGDYLSSDPNAGEPITATSAPKRGGWPTAPTDIGLPMLRTMGNLGLGAVRGVGQSVTNLGELVHKIPGVSTAVDAAWDLVYGPRSKSMPSLSQAAFADANARLQPQNTTQAIGKMGEQIAEVITPARAIESTAMNVGARLGKMSPKLILPGRMAVEAAGGAGIAGMQGGSPTVGGVLGAAVPAVGVGVKALGPVLKTSAVKSVEQGLGAGKERLKALGAKITPEILKRGLSGSRETLKAEADEAVRAVGKQIDTALGAYGERTASPQPILDALAKAKSKYLRWVGAPAKAAETGEATLPLEAGFQRTASDVFTGETEQALWPQVLNDALKNGYKGKSSDLLEKFSEAVRDARDLQDDIARELKQQVPDSKKLLQAIAKNGGISLKKEAKSGGEAGEIRWFLEGSGGRERKGSWGGVRGVFKEGGGERIYSEAKRKFAKEVYGKTLAVPPKTWDEMREAIQNDPAFAGLKIDTLQEFQALIRAAGKPGGGSSERTLSMPLGAALERVGVRPGAAWFKGSTDFNPAELEGAAQPVLRSADQGVPVNYHPRKVKAIQKLEDLVQQHGSTMTVEQMVGLRRAWDEVVAEAGGYGVPGKKLKAEAWAKNIGANQIRKILDEAVPELSALNKEFTFWKRLDDVLTDTLRRTGSQGPGLRTVAAEGAGRLAGVMTAGKAGAASTVGHVWVLGKMLKLAQRAFESPRWRFASAQMKDDLATAIMEGRTERAAQILSRIASSQGAQLATVGATSGQ